MEGSDKNGANLNHYRSESVDSFEKHSIKVNSLGSNPRAKPSAPEEVHAAPSVEDDVTQFTKLISKICIQLFLNRETRDPP